jgi:hypothetical protein
MSYQELNTSTGECASASGDFIDLEQERFYRLSHVDKLAPFFISLVSDSDHWMFISSTGGLTAGRVSPDTALFPYITVDRVHESAGHTGSKTLIRVETTDGLQYWEPFNQEHDHHYSVSRHLYKNLLGDKLCFEEINHSLQLAFRYTWKTSEEFGFIRDCELENRGTRTTNVELIDGLQNILPAGTPRLTQTNASNLVDAYKWNELDEKTGLACFTLYSGITDRAEPCESLKATTVFSLGLESADILLSSAQLDNFRRGGKVCPEQHNRGVRGAYLISTSLELPPETTRDWQLVANIEQSQRQVVALRSQLGNPHELSRMIADSIMRGTDSLAKIVASGDGFQLTAEESVTAHHYANSLFNIMRGGIFDDQYQVSARDFSRTIGMFNQALYQRHKDMFQSLDERLSFSQLQSIIKQQGDPQLERLGLEYLPITFGRRHGDPSRPWNQFAINLKDKNGDRLLSYQGNWRDIFQNWEALTFSYPDFVESVIAKFVNASTMDGYNPYRITKEGIEWEEEDPEDAWSYIGYWGDHQIIYLQKLLEASNQFHPQRLSELLHQPIFSYANVPYRIKPLSSLLKDAKSTVEFDHALASLIEKRVADIGADGKLVLNEKHEVYQVTLLEKLLVPLLSKLGNLFIDVGIWLNTQRPEWNDDNNALVGHGLSMVTLYYLRRYLCFLQTLLTNQPESVSLSESVSQWLTATASALAKIRPLLGGEPISAGQRYQTLVQLGEAASSYRHSIYQQNSFSERAPHSTSNISDLICDALAAVDHTIATNRREDGLYHSYNLLNVQSESIEIDELYPMLEGQVSVLSSCAIAPAEAVTVLKNLFASDIYRADQKTFMLYPDRQLPGFLEKNRVPDEQVKKIPVLLDMLANNDHSLLEKDSEGCYRFNADFTSIANLDHQIDQLIPRYGDRLRESRDQLRALYENVFNHQAFTGRSGGMFGFEGLGCIYWHMVAKLLLAVAENFFAALEQGADGETCQDLGRLYYRVREGLGFNKTPAEYGAFPTDPYSHTPGQAGAQQPGMTGQVKEELIARFMELGIRVNNGTVSFLPALLRPCEFIATASEFRYLDVDGNWQTLLVPDSGLAFTWCQTPVLMILDDNAEPGLTVHFDDGTNQALANSTRPPEVSTELFMRNGRIRRLDLVVHKNQLFTE